MNVTIIGTPHRHDDGGAGQKIPDIKALRESWQHDYTRDDGTTGYDCASLRESKYAMDEFYSCGKVVIDVDMASFNRMKAAGFVMKEDPAIIKMDAMMAARETTLLAVRQLVQEGLDSDDADMVEALMPAYLLAVRRKKKP